MRKIARKWNRRRIGKVVLIVAIVLSVTIAAAPWLLGSRFGRSWLVARANHALAPATIEVGSLRLSWFDPIELTAFVLRDARGKRLVVAPRVTLDRSPWQLLVDRRDLGTATLDGAAVDIERGDDGSIDLVDAFGSEKAAPDHQSSSSSGLELTLRIRGGSLRLRSPELVDPLTADRMGLLVHLPKAPGPLTWRIDLANPATDPTASLTLDGQYDHRAQPGTSADLVANLSGADWPLATRLAGILARGRIDGKARLSRNAGRLTLSGDARLLGLDVSGSALAGDRVKLDQVGVGWDLAQAGGGWEVSRLILHSSLANLSVGGTNTTMEGSSARLEGRIDLAALALQLPHALRLREGLALNRGEATVRVDLRAESGSQLCDVEARVSDLIARDEGRTIAIRDPATLSARLALQGKTVRVERLALTTPFLKAGGVGDLDHGVTLSATLDLGGVQGAFRDLIDFGGIEMAGRGRLAADYRRAGPAFTGRLAAELRDVRLAGPGFDSIDHDALRLDASIGGTADGTGIPLAWKAARVALKAGEVAGLATATSKDDAIELSASASGPFRLSDRDVRADGRIVARWQAPALDIVEARAALAPKGSGAGSIGLAGRGRWDSASGELALNPLPGTDPGAIGLAADGLRIAGLGKAGASLRVEGSLTGDLAKLDRAIAAWGGGRPHDLAGDWSARISAREDARGDWEVAGNLSASRFGTLTAKGRLAEPGGRRLIDLSGTLAPDWRAIDAIVADAIEPGAIVRGNPRSFHVRGPITGGTTVAILRQLDADLGIDLTEAKAFGMTLGPAPIVVRCGGGRVAIDPIESTLNGGRVDIRPEIVLDDAGGATLRLASGSAIDGAQINEEVSRKLLAYVAPVLQESTEVRGKISVAVDPAEFALLGDGKTAANGRVVFDNVVFAPGPLAEHLVTLVDRGRPPELRLHQVLQLAVADGRVYQRGLSIPIGGGEQISLDGSVGFDRTLALRAGVPVTKTMLGHQAVLDEVVAGTRIAVPIGGTLAEPRIDRQAVRVALRDVGRSLLKRGAAVGASELLQGLEGPGGNPGPPPRASGRQAIRGLEEDVLRRFLPGDPRP